MADSDLPLPTDLTGGQARRVFRKELLSLIVIYLSLPWLWWWGFHVPSPGVAGAALAVVAAFMGLLGEMAGLEKAAWMLLLFGFLFVEVSSIDMERTVHEREQSIAKYRYQKQMDAQAQQFAATMNEMLGINALSKKALSVSSNALQQITGGGQYCYLMGIPLNGPGQANLAVMNSGPLPLERCLVVIHENFAPKSAQDAERLMRPLVAKELGPVSPGPKEGMITDIVLPSASYYIQIYTRNNRFYEYLTMHPIPKKGQGFETIEVRNEKWKVVYSSN